MKGGAAGVKDAAGNALAADFARSFTTVASSDTTAPGVSLTGPANGSTVSGTVTMSATASDNLGVAGVQFKLDGGNLGTEDTTAPYSASWNSTSAANGTRALTAVARDAAGNQATSPSVTVTVSNAAPPPTSGPVGAYSLDAGAGGTAADVSGNNNNGTIAGATWVTQGRFGAALSFDGVNDLVNIAAAASLDLTTGLTLEAWVKPAALSGWRSVLMKEINAGLAYAVYANDNDPKPSGYVHIAGQSLSAGTSGGAQIPLNTWTHLATTFDGTTLRMFVDGGQVDSQSVSGSIMPSSNPLRLGGNAVWGEYFSGLIDEVRIYNRALSATEIQIDMATPVSSPPSPPTNVRIVR